MYGAASFDVDGIVLETENPTVLIRYSKLLREVVKPRGMTDFELANIASNELIFQILSEIGVSGEEPLYKLRRDAIKCEFCGWSFVRGVFLSCGTITYPANSYHLEFLMRDNEALEFYSLLKELGASPRIIERGEKQKGIYFKDSEEIVEILGHIGANRAAFEILNVKIYKDIRNNANRVRNCELANIGKVIAASNEQMRAIETIIESDKAGELPDELKTTLDLRAAFPDATLAELAEMHNPPITKSGVNHRLKRLVEFSKKC
ncbi:MAG: DNA-binding protein WhiA, partial [Clostridia bacterium]|nr:DNA-binding protein WhiA [Clostridia bacterium]